MAYELKIGENIKKDIKEYYKCVLKGVESNDYYCLNELGDIYYFGNDELKIKKDFIKKQAITVLCVTATSKIGSPWEEDLNIAFSGGLQRKQ